jgi:hypothetical protein
MVISADSDGSQGGTILFESGFVYYSPPTIDNTNDTFHFTVSDSYGATASAVATVELLQNAEILDTTVQTGADVTLTIAGLPGRTYNVQACDDLSSGIWNTIGSVTLPADLGWTVFIDVGGGGHALRFYRVQLVALP